MRHAALIVLMAATSLLGAQGVLKNAGQPLLWTGMVTAGSGPTGEVPECAPGCQRFDLTVDLPGGVQVAIRWTGVLYDNLRLYIYQGGVLKAKSDGIISIAQGVLIREPSNGLFQVYVAHDPDSPTATIPYEGLAEVEYDPLPNPPRRLLPDLEVRRQNNISFEASGFPFDETSPDYPSCYKTEVEEDGARLCLRFDQIFANTGEGAMDLRFRVPTGTTPSTVDVSQRIYSSSPSGLFEDRLAGQVEYHPAHLHYHFLSLGLSNLWAVDSNGNKSGTQPLRRYNLKRAVQVDLARAGSKMGFCLADVYLDTWAKKGDGPRTYNPGLLVSRLERRRLRLLRAGDHQAGAIPKTGICRTNTLGLRAWPTAFTSWKPSPIPTTACWRRRSTTTAYPFMYG
jgi:hypothetical protein